MDSTTNFFGEGLWGVIIFLIVAGVFNGNGFGFGGNRGIDQVTNEFLFNNLANQNRDIMAGINQNSRDTLENRYTTQLGFQALGSQMADCCCSIKSEMASNTQKILDKMCENEINSLRDALNTANLQLSQQAQSASLIEQLKPYPVPSYIVGSPYASYGCYGYNGCNC